MALGAALVAVFNPGVKTLPSTALDPSVLLPDFSSLAAAPLPFAGLISATLKIAGTVAFVTLVTARALKVEGRDAYGRELRNQGVANLAVAAIGGIPVTIGFIRTRILQRGGAESPAAGILTGIFIILILVFLQPVLTRIPTAVFIGILLRAGVVSLDLQAWKSFREAPARGWFSLAFVLAGAVASVFFDPITVLLVAVVLWKILERIQLTRRSCHDIGQCPDMA